jgi:MoxR-like ATPase
MTQWHYIGDGSRQLPSAPDYEPVTLRDPQQYHASTELSDAVNVAILLGMPLLITGDPGTGKTELAYSVSWEMGLPGPIIFNAKTTSTSQELFYR